MTNPNLTEIIVILDRSGSMQSISADMCGGFDHLIDTQRSQPGECHVTLVQFDDRYDVVYAAKPVADVPPIVLQPRGRTALLDAIGRTLSEVGLRLAVTDESARPSKVIVVIITDGLENASVEYSAEQIQRMVSQQRDKYSWEFVYLGANQDAIEIAKGLGVKADDATSYTASARGARAMFGAVAHRASAVRGGVKADAMSDRYRKALENDPS